MIGVTAQYFLVRGLSTWARRTAIWDAAQGVRPNEEEQFTGFAPVDVKSEAA
jgi:hypothetical protein